nr:alpha/beta-hydrolase N-terminal domain-containing protein [Mobilicoccus caccae]
METEAARDRGGDVRSQVGRATRTGSSSTTPVSARPTWPGLLGALVLGVSALSPSLIPRTWWMTAFNLGICLTYGYGLGLLLAWMARLFSRWTGLSIRMRPGAARLVGRVLLVAILLAALEMIRRSIELQDDISRRIGADPFPLSDHLLGIVAGVALFGALFLVFRTLRGMWRLLRRMSRPFLPGIASATTSLIIIVWLVVFVSNDVFFARFVESATRQAALVNAQSPPGRTPPPRPPAPVVRDLPRRGRPSADRGRVSWPTVPAGTGSRR